MQSAKLTYHAAKRLNQRCTISPKQFKKLLDKCATIPLSQQRGGRLVHRLFYSIPDEAWFVAVQDDNNGDVLTTLPLAYFENFHGHVSALNRRKARKLARELQVQKNQQLKTEEAARAAKLTAKKEALEAEARLRTGWKISARWDVEGKIYIRNLGKTTLEHGDPETWVAGHAIHVWFRERLDTLCVPIRALSAVWLERGKQEMPGDVLLEGLIMTETEIQALR